MDYSALARQLGGQEVGSSLPSTATMPSNTPPVPQGGAIPVQTAQTSSQTFNGDYGAAAQQLGGSSVMGQQGQQQEGANLHDTGSFGGNLANSAGNFLGGIGNAIMHPIDTVTNLGKTAIGLGGQALNATKLTNFSGDNIQAAQNIEKFFVERYGSLDKLKQTAYQDPMGFLADASVFLTGAGGAIGKVGELADVSKVADVGNVVSKMGEIANPINIAGKAINNPVTRGVGGFIGDQAANILGTTTGAGGSSIKGIINAAREGSPEAINASRGAISDSQIIQTAQDALDNLKQSRNITYQEQLAKVKGIGDQVDFRPTLEEFNTQLKNNGITVTKDGLNFEKARGFQTSSEQAVLQNTYNKLKSWGEIPINNTAFSLDTLKQQLGDFYEQANGKARPIIAQVKSSLSDILKQNPEYKNLVEPYESTSKLIDEMKAGLVSKNPETTLKKLTKAVSQDNEYRKNLIQELQKSAPNGENIQQQLAGLNMQGWVNKSKFFTTFQELGSLLHPALLSTFLGSSPRIVAEFMNGLGWSAGKIDTALSFLKTYKAATAANVAGRAQKATSPSGVVQPKPNSTKQIRVLVPQKAPPR